MISPNMNMPPSASFGELVTNYRSASQNKDPMLYPGERPTDSYITDGTSVFDIKVTACNEGLAFEVDSSAGPVPINSLLEERGVPLMEDRIPVLAFGANMSPGSLASKFKKVGRDDAKIIPTIYASLPGHDVVWSGGPGVNGNFIAILYQGRETQDTSVQVGINFLTREQLLVMHATELAYDLNTVELVIDGKPLKAYFYDGVDSVFLENGSPVAVENIPAVGRTLPATNTREMLKDVLEDPDIMTSLLELHPDLLDLDVDSYVAYAQKLTQVKGGKLALKKSIHERIKAHGKSKIVDKTHSRNGAMNWANPSMLPTYGEQLTGALHHNIYRLPSQELHDWVDPAARAGVLGSIAAHLVRLSDGELVHKTD